LHNLLGDEAENGIASTNITQVDNKRHEKIWGIVGNEWVSFASDSGLNKHVLKKA
jgi:hypothetical protein